MPSGCIFSLLLPDVDVAPTLVVIDGFKAVVTAVENAVDVACVEAGALVEPPLMPACVMADVTVGN